MTRISTPLAILLASATALGATGCPDNSLRALNFGKTAIITGDFDTVEQLIQEVANVSEVQAELHRFHGYVDGPHFETEVDPDPGQQVEDLLRGELNSLSSFSTVFFSCGMRGVGKFRYNGVAEDDHLVIDGTVIENLRGTATRGANLYFSDWTYDFVEAAWPDQIEWLGGGDLDDAQKGIAGAVTARVVNEELATQMGVPEGSQIEIEFNQGGWAVMTGVADGVDVLVEGDIFVDDLETGQPRAIANAPLVVAFDSPTGSGRIVFTAFHNEAQLTDDARDVLRFQLGQLAGN